MARKAQTSVVERKPSSIRWQSVSVWPVSNENHEPVKTKRRAGKKFKPTARNEVYAAPGAAPAPSTPTSYRYDGATAVGRYFVPGDAARPDLQRQRCQRHGLGAHRQ